MTEFNIPDTYLDATISDIQKEHRQKIGNFINGKTKGLYICGDVGAGKTHLAYALRNGMERYLHDNIGFCLDNVIKTSQLIEFMSTVDYSILEEVYMYDDVLFLDDFGDSIPEDRYLRVTQRMNELVYFREMNKLPTVFTSNFSLEKIAEKFDARIADRINGMCEVIKMTGESKRDVILNADKDKIKEIIKYYRKLIYKDALFISTSKNKIKERLEKYTLEDLCKAIEKFSESGLLKSKCKESSIMSWFFDSDERIKSFLELKEGLSYYDKPDFV